MNNRIQHLLEPCAESPPTSEYFVVTGEFGQVLVTRTTAAHLRAKLGRLVPPRWMEFRSLFGASWRVRTRMILTISESTVDQRAAMRALWRQLEAEENAESNPYE